MFTRYVLIYRICSCIKNHIYNEPRLCQKFLTGLIVWKSGALFWVGAFKQAGCCHIYYGTRTSWLLSCLKYLTFKQLRILHTNLRYSRHFVALVIYPVKTDQKYLEPTKPKGIWLYTNTLTFRFPALCFLCWPLPRLTILHSSHLRL